MSGHTADRTDRNARIGLDVRTGLRTGVRAGFGIAIGLSLAACGGGSIPECLGLTRSAPDEFQVVSRAPLALPPNYDLRPPQPGAEGPSTRSVSAEAREALVTQGESAAPASAGETALIAGAAASAAAPSQVSTGESALLKSAQAETADPSIRQVVGADEASRVAIDSRKFLFIASWQRTPTEERRAEETLDPVAEAARLKATGGGAMTVRVSSTPIALGG